MIKKKRKDRKLIRYTRNILLATFFIALSILAWTMIGKYLWIALAISGAGLLILFLFKRLTIKKIKNKFRQIFVN